MDVLTGLLAMIIIGIIINLIIPYLYAYKDEITVGFMASFWFSVSIYLLYYIAKLLGHLILTWLQ